MTASYYITNLNLLPHPEGGFYSEVYRSEGIIPARCLPHGFPGNRHYSTSIYFLLEQGNFSAFHRIRSDECWHFYEGYPLLVHIIYPTGNYKCVRLGKALHEGEVIQFVVPAGCWFASECAPESGFSLVGCTVSPGFDFADFEMAERQSLMREFPVYKELIQRLCRE